MRADALHGCIQKKWNKENKIVTLEDFKQVCDAQEKKARVEEMTARDFYSFRHFTKSKKPWKPSFKVSFKKHYTKSSC